MLPSKAQFRKRSNIKKQVAKCDPIYLNEMNQIIISATAKRLRITNSDVVNSLLNSINLGTNRGKKTTVKGKANIKSDAIILSPENKIIVDDAASQIGKDSSFIINALLYKIDLEPVLNSKKL